MKIFKNRIFLGGMCLILAVLISFVAVPIVNRLTSSTIEVYRVKEDVGMGTQLTEDLVEKVEIGKLNIPSIPATDFKQIKNLYVTVDMKAKDIIYGNKVTDKLVIPENKIRKMSLGESAYTIKIGDAYRSRLLPNDIITFKTFDESGKAHDVEELKYVSVVTTTTSDKVDILYASQVAKDGKALVPDTLTLILDKNQIDTLLTLEHSGNFKIALTYRGDDESVIEDYLNQQKAYQSSSNITVTDAGDMTAEN